MIEKVDKKESEERKQNTKRNSTTIEQENKLSLALSQRLNEHKWGGGVWEILGEDVKSQAQPGLRTAVSPRLENWDAL